jgi:hypothetical protein
VFILAIYKIFLKKIKNLFREGGLAQLFSKNRVKKGDEEQ